MRVRLASINEKVETGKWRRYGIGIDCHSRFLYCCIQVPDYQQNQVHSYERTFPTTQPEIQHAWEWATDVLRGHGIDDPEPVYAIESTATYHFPILLYFRGRPIVLNPYVARASLKKTDRFDAGVMAYHCLTGLYREVCLVRDVGEEYRIHVRSRLRVAAYHRRVFSTMTLRLIQYGITLPSLPWGVNSTRVRPVLEDLATGRISLEQVPEELAGAFVGSHVPSRIWRMMLDYYDFADAHHKVITAWQAAEKHLLASERCWVGNQQVLAVEAFKLLCSVPGIGDSTAASFLAEIWDWRRFTTAEQVAAYAGFDPSRRVSAGKVVSTETRQGNRWLRRSFVQAAQLLLNRRAEPLGLWAYRLKQRSKHNVAVVALARRLVRIGWHVLRTGQPFDQSRYRTQGQRQAVEDVLPKRIARLLHKGGIRWLDELQRLIQKGPLNLPGVGPTTERLIREACCLPEGSEGDGEKTSPAKTASPSPSRSTKSRAEVSMSSKC